MFIITEFHYVFIKLLPSLLYLSICFSLWWVRAPPTATLFAIQSVSYHSRMFSKEKWFDSLYFSILYFTFSLNESKWYNDIKSDLVSLLSNGWFSPVNILKLGMFRKLQDTYTCKRTFLLLYSRVRLNRVWKWLLNYLSFLLLIIFILIIIIIINYSEFKTINFK